MSLGQQQRSLGWKAWLAGGGGFVMVTDATFVFSADGGRLSCVHIRGRNTSLGEQG